MNSGAIRTAERGHGWIIALVPLCGCLAVIKSLIPAASTDPAYLLGNTLVYALVVLGVFYAIFLRGRGAMWSLLALGAIWMSLFTGGLLAAKKGGNDLEQALSGIQADVHDFAKSSTDADGMPVPSPVKTDAGPVADGPIGQGQALMRGMLADMATSRNAYLNSLNAMGWDRLLDADRLKADPGMRDGLAMLDKAEASIATHEAEYEALVGGLKGRIDALDLSRGQKAAMWEGAQRSVATGQAQVREQFRLERASVKQFRNIIALLGSVPWEAQDGQMLFHTDADASAFNGYLEAINRNTARQQALQNAALEDFDGRVESMKRKAR